MSWSLFGSSDPHAPNFHPVVNASTPAQDLFGELEPKDLEWKIDSGIVTETQTWYHTLQDGRFLLFQIIHSSVGMFYPTVQFTFKLWNPATKEKTWKSVNVSNFTTPPPASGSKKFDKRSSKSDRFSITHQSTSSDVKYAESYVVTANVDTELQISLTVSRPKDIPGFKVGKSPTGGFSYFGSNLKSPEGYVVHRFWPRTECSGHIIHKGQAIEAVGTGMFIHAIQGMRPNLIAASWNFADFQSSENGGASGVMMEFKTIDAYGRKGAGSGGVTVNVGSIVVGGKLIAVTGETTWPDEPAAETSPIKSRAIHLEPTLDPETSYKQPKKVRFVWEAPSISKEASGSVKAEVTTDVGSPDAPNGLIEKVDVLGEIPTVIRAFVNYVAGTKPYIYQWLNPATLKITAPGKLLGGADESEKTVSIYGTVFNEATFIS